MTAAVLGLLPLLVVASAATALAVAVGRSLRDEQVVEGLRAELRMLGETQRAVLETRARQGVRRHGS